jgi:hypothetical protein
MPTRLLPTLLGSFSTFLLISVRKTPDCLGFFFFEYSRNSVVHLKETVMSQSSFADLSSSYKDPLYIAQYKKALRNIATDIRNHGYPFAWAFLFREQGCIEIRTWLGFGNLIATVEVWGSEGAPYLAIVTSPPTLSEKSKDLFRKAIPFPIMFKAL